MSGNDSTQPSFLLADEELTALIAGELGTYGKLKPEVSARRWQFSLPRRNGAARISDDWLILDFAPRGRPPAPQRLLEKNLTLTGNAKYVLGVDGAVRLLAEIPLDGVPIQGLTGIGQHIREGVLGIAAALGTTIPNLPEEVTGVGDAPAPSLADLCEEAGWPFDQRGDERVSVDLECTGDAFFQATVELESGRIAQRVTPFRGVAAPGDQTSRLSVAALFLSVSACVRLARAVAWPSDHGAVPGFQVDLPVATSAAAFGHGLAALSVACDMCGREAVALAEDRSLAEAFLELRHPGLLPRAQRATEHSAPSGSQSTTPH